MPISRYSYQRSIIPLSNYVDRLRGILARQYPGVTFYVLPVDIVTQILNFGLSAPIDIQIIGPNLYGNRALAERMLEDVRHVPGAVGCAHPAALRYPQYDGECGSYAGLSAGTDAAKRGAEPSCCAERQLSNFAELLSRSSQWRKLQRCHANPAVWAGFCCRICEACRLRVRTAMPAHQPATR